MDVTTRAVEALESPTSLPPWMYIVGDETLWRDPLWMLVVCLFVLRLGLLSRLLCSIVLL